MNIYDTDGEKIIDFIRQNYCSDLPAHGFLAGQAVCSVLMYLKGLLKDIVLNDIDVFHIENDFGWSRSAIKYNSYHIVGGLSIEQQKMQVFRSSNDKSTYKIKRDQAVKHYFSQLGEVDSDAEDYDEIMQNIERQYTKKIDVVSGRVSYYRSNSYDTYMICDVFRKGLINSVVVKSISGNYVAILKGFDINCTQVGVCLSTKKIYFTPEFLRFLNTLKLEVTNASRPSHTLIRLIKKQSELRLPFDEMRSIEALSVSLLLNNKTFRENILESELELASNLKSTMTASTVMEYRIPKMGKVYLEKYQSVKHLLPGFHLQEYNLNREGYSEDKDVKVLYDLSTTLELPKYITSGTHREALEKRLKSKILGYSSILKEYAVGIINHYHDSNKRIVIPVTKNKAESRSLLKFNYNQAQQIKDTVALKEVEVSKKQLNSKQYNELLKYQEFWSKLASVPSDSHQNIYDAMISFKEKCTNLYTIYNRCRQRSLVPYVELDGSFHDKESALDSIEKFRRDISESLHSSQLRDGLQIRRISIDSYNLDAVNSYLDVYKLYFADCVLNETYIGRRISLIGKCACIPVSVTKENKEIGMIMYGISSKLNYCERLTFRNSYVKVLDDTVTESELKDLAKKYLFKLSELGIINEIKKIYANNT